ncbi:hypothetical protein DN402_08630 [Streptomyces sp. SW4]|nr:hypothetical protein DN402_08630 [Streptomyces sp. SW4]
MSDRTRTEGRRDAPTGGRTDAPTGGRRDAPTGGPTGGWPDGPPGGATDGSPDAAPGGWPDGRTAGSLRLLTGLTGPLRVLAAPGGLDVPVRGTVIHDPGDPLPAAPSALLLLVGADVSDPRTREVLRRAAAEGYAGVVVKCRGQETERLVAEAGRSGVSVLAAGDAVPWRYVDAEIGCALAAYGVGDLSPSAPAGTEELFALADAVAAAVGGSVAVEDLDQHVVAYSNVPGQRIDGLRERGILERRVPDDPGQRQQYREVLAAPGVVRFPQAGDELARAAVAVRAGRCRWARSGRSSRRAACRSGPRRRCGTRHASRPRTCCARSTPRRPSSACAGTPCARSSTGTGRPPTRPPRASASPRGRRSAWPRSPRTRAPRSSHTWSRPWSGTARRTCRRPRSRRRPARCTCCCPRVPRPAPGGSRTGRSAPPGPRSPRPYGRR